MKPQLDLTACDREPIHIPDAVQPHGVLLVLDRASRVIEQAGGACEVFFGAPAEALLGRRLADLLAEGALALDQSEAQPGYVGAVAGADGTMIDAVAHAVADKLVVEFERAPERRASTAELARRVESASRAFAASRSVSELAQTAARVFRELTGFDRVMVYRFLPDETGAVIAEERVEALPSFLHHRYPASDIPRQARELYVRNIIRVIGDVGYTPTSLVKQDLDEPPLDMSMCHLRSVSPVHIQYLKNMEVAASSSVSIIRDGKLWGLVACHHRAPKHLSLDERTVCRLVATALSQQISGLEDADLYSSRLKARAAEDSLLAALAREAGVDDALEVRAGELLTLIPAHGVAIRRGGTVTLAGRCPDATQVLPLSDWLLERDDAKTFSTDSLQREYAPAAAFPQVASGLLAVTVSTAEPYQLMWFRAEQIEEINWAGNPHKAVESATPGALTPRKSFEAWRETVHGRSEPWSVVDVEAAARIARPLAELQRSASMNRLNETLKRTLRERDNLITQKDHLLREGDHRIQNSLQIVGGMLRMQLREVKDPGVRGQLEEAQARVQAVALVHRRLHQSDEPKVVSVDAYVEELLNDLGASLGEDWSRQFRVHAAPVSAPTEVAMSVGLVLTELTLNAAKYAYGGEAGPLEIDLSSRDGALRLCVRDWGEGLSNVAHGSGLGSRLVAGLVERFGGVIERSEADPGLRVVVTIPLSA